MNILKPSSHIYYPTPPNQISIADDKWGNGVPALRSGLRVSFQEDAPDILSIKPGGEDVLMDDLMLPGLWRSLTVWLIGALTDSTPFPIINYKYRITAQLQITDGVCDQFLPHYTHYTHTHT